MNEESFDQLSEQAAAGLRADPELFLDVKQELRTHLEEKAEYFSSQGHSHKESVELAGKSFGSPMEVASEILEGNKARMKFRGRVRLLLGALVVPLAVILALYLSLGRVLSITGVEQALTNRGANPMARLFNPYPDRGIEIRRQVFDGTPKSILSYWKRHQSDSESGMYYAAYLLSLATRRTDKKMYEEAARRGQHLEPNNAFYNLAVAGCCFQRGILSRDEKDYHLKNKTDDLLDRRELELGIAEAREAVRKPYIKTYRLDLLRKELNTMPPAIFTEDYIGRLDLMEGEVGAPDIIHRRVAFGLTAAVRMMIREGRRKEAEDLLTTCYQLAGLIADEPDQDLIDELSNLATLGMLAGESAEGYSALGDTAKAKRFKSIHQKLRSITKKNDGRASIVYDRASMLTAMMVGAVHYKPKISDLELAPGRMHEHVLMEEAAIVTLLAVFLSVMLIAVVSGYLYLHGARGAASVPMLLLPPVKIVLRALLLGIALPMLIYWIYSRLPVIGGREYSISSAFRCRFASELFILWMVMFIVPIRIIRGYIRGRCRLLEIDVPANRAETVIQVTMRILVLTILCTLAAAGMNGFSDLMVVILLLSAVGMIANLIHARREHKRHPLYYGTLARSMVPLYALAIIFLALVVQPWLMYNEAKLLREDKVGIGYVGKATCYGGGISGVDPRVAAEYASRMRDALK
jgi:hypothetical protein